MSTFINLHNFSDCDNSITDKCIENLQNNDIDFSFLYLGDTDSVGHRHGWITKEQLNTINNSVSCIQKIYDAFKDNYTIIVTADHGGHDRGHGTNMSEDMFIPLFIFGEGKGLLKEECSIMDIAPTITKLMNIEKDFEWEGVSLL